MRFFSLIAAATLLCGSFLRAQQGPQLPAEQHFSRANGVAYMQGKTGPLLADVYVPHGEGRFPAILFLHGGGWIAGGRDSPEKVMVPMAEQGYVAVSIDYDLSPAVRFPVALEECKAAVRWMRAHAAEFHIDPARIAVAGASAGGELAALVALTGDDPRYEGLGGSRAFSSGVKAAILYSSDLDLTVFPEEDASIRAYLGGSCAAQHALCLQASPQQNLGGKLPPIFIGHGNADHDVPYSQFTSFVAAYKQAHGPVTPFTAEQGPHSYVVDPRYFQASLDATLKFLHENL